MTNTVKLYIEKLEELIDLLELYAVIDNRGDHRLRKQLLREITNLKQQIEAEVITDSDIDAWAKDMQEKELLLIQADEKRLRTISFYLSGAAKAFRDGEIKHIK